MIFDANVSRRFDAKVIRGGDDECWPWTGAKKRSGHGTFWIGGTVFMPAHRFSLSRAMNCEISPDLCACHHCDNPPCVNPAHLFVGTKRENALDAQAKGRLVGGRGKFRAHCQRGHPLAGANIEWRKNGRDGGRTRLCRTCHEATRARAQAKIEARRGIQHPFTLMVRT